MLSFVNIVSANPGIVVTVIPDSLNAQLGETVIYQVKTESISDVSEHVVLSIKDPVAGWEYVFDNTEFNIDPEGVVTTNLHVSVPSDASQETYQANVRGTATVPGFEERFELLRTPDIQKHEECHC